MSETRALSIRAAGSATPTYRMGGTEVPLITDPRCRVCMSRHRFDAEEQIIIGTSFGKINDRLPEEVRFSASSLRRHWQRHMAMEHSEARALVERRAIRVGKRIEDSEQSLVDGITLMEAVVQKTFEAIARGEITPKLRDGLYAAKALADLGEYDGDDMDQQAYAQAFSAFMDESLALMGEDMFAQFGSRLGQNPVIRSLMSRYNQQDPQPQTVPGEVVEQPSEDS